MNHAAGDLNVRAFIENPTVTTDDYGETQTLYVAGPEIWIGVNAASGNEGDVANRQVAVTEFVVKLRKTSFMFEANRTRFRLKNDGRILNLVEVPRDPDGRGGDWEVRCQEGDQEED